MRLLNGSNANNHFANVPKANIPRSAFNRSHGHKTTFNSGLLIPVFWDEVYPGDTFNMNAQFFCRLATPIFPIMDNIYLDVQYFFIPTRLVWDNWEQFNGFQANPTDSTDFIMPTITSVTGGYLTGSIFDYFGLPTLVAGIETISTPLRAYNLVWNEWYRDENLQDSVVVQTDDGPDVVTNYALLPRGKRRDYFTSCLPFAQKGTAINLPLGTTAPVIGNNDSPWLHYDPNGISGFLETTATPNNPLNIAGSSPAINSPLFWGKTNANTVDTGLVTDLSAATAATINQLRLAFQMQRMLERDARGGTRYVEVIFAHFNVISPDFRLQRPEFLGSGSTLINITPVAQTSPATGTGAEDTPQGNLAGYGVGALKNGFTQSFVEHGYVIGLVSVRADYTYQQGTERSWFRSTRFDFYWPALSHIGEQAVLNQEIFTQGTAGGSADKGVFGYQEAWAELRYKPSRISGLFRSNASGTLDAWHLSQDFGSLPTLSPTFIVENPPMARIKAVTSQPDFIFDSHFEYHCARPLPVYSVPGLIDHF